MSRDIPEPDWKVFRQLSRIALDRYCQRILDEIALIATDTKETAHERYGKIFEVVQQRDRTIAEAFDGMRRSTAILQLLIVCSHGLLTDEEIGKFTQNTRDVI
jgi:hypothetical protein